MASFGFSVRVYGEVDQQAPYVTPAGGNLPGISATYSATAAQAVNFPTTNVNIYPISGYGAIMGGGVSCYGVIEVPPTGLNQEGKKYVVQQTVTALAVLRNA